MRGLKNIIWHILFIIVIISCGIRPSWGEEMKKPDIIILPSPDTRGEVALEAAIQKRRSVRRFTGQALTLDEIGQLLWAAQGITSKRGYRAAPSAGALYPLEVYIAKKDGLFLYIPDGHKLKRISPDDIRSALQSASLSQACVGSAAVDIIICAVYSRVTSKYGKRGIRYTDIEVGHAAQNIHLQAEALGLSSVPIGAFSDDAVAEALSLPEEQAPLYIIPVGYKE
jgi:SagB-type dehydrogenase family enzyme